MRVIATPQDAMALDECVGLAEQIEHVLCVGCQVTYHMFIWDDLTSHEYDMVLFALQHFGVQCYGTAVK
jgi:hypothetical protein